MIINKENIEALVASSDIKKPKRDELFEAVNGLMEMEELLEQMDSDTIDYEFETYIETQDAYYDRICLIAKLAKDVRV